MFHIMTKSIPVEAAYSMLIVKRYQDPLGTSFFMLPKGESSSFDIDLLQMTVRSVNDSGSADGSVPKLLANGALPRLNNPKDSRTQSTHQRKICTLKSP